MKGRIAPTIRPFGSRESAPRRRHGDARSRRSVAVARSEGRRIGVDTYQQWTERTTWPPQRRDALAEVIDDSAMRGATASRP